MTFESITKVSAKVAEHRASDHTADNSENRAKTMADSSQQRNPLELRRLYSAEPLTIDSPIYPFR